jgi:hypothetical protein
MKIMTILARHGRTKYGAALETLRSYQQRCLARSSCELLVVDNALPAGGMADEEGCEVISGSGRAREFSAWDEGLAHVGQRLWSFDFVQLVTAAFDTLYTRYIDRLDDATLGLVAGRAVAVGHVDRYNQAVELLGVASQHWIRSSFVFLPPAELVVLGRLAVQDGLDGLFSGDPARPFRADAPLSMNYQGYILDWLTGQGTGQGTTWHSRFQLDAGTLGEFEAKTRAILSEHLLSIRLRRQGCAIVDATWLGTQSRRAGRPIIGAIPDWRTQLAGRDADAVPFSAV